MSLLSLEKLLLNCHNYTLYQQDNLNVSYPDRFLNINMTTVSKKLHFYIN